MVLGDLGEGYPILFQLMKYVNYLLLGLTIGFYIPAIAFISESVKAYGSKVSNDEDLSLYSFGAMLKCLEPERYVDLAEREDFILAYCGIL